MEGLAGEGKRVARREVKWRKGEGITRMVAGERGEKTLRVDSTWGGSRGVETKSKKIRGP